MNFKKLDNFLLENPEIKKNSKNCVIFSYFEIIYLNNGN